MLPASSKIRLASWKNERGMMTIARRRFPRARGKEALVALSAVVAGIAGSIATLVTTAMMMAGH
jgi:hypothetical protein